MTLAVYNGIAAIPDASGVLSIVANAYIEVRGEVSGDLATIYSDSAGTSDITQGGTSYQAEDDGSFVFYVAGVEGGISVKITDPDDDTKTVTLHSVAVGTAAQLDAGSVGADVLAASTEAAARTAIGVDLFGKNRLINMDGRIYQRAVAATADDTYFADRWYMLTQTASVTPSVLSDPEDGYPKGIRITQSQATAQRFGFAQIIEGANCKDLRGGSGVLVPRIRASAAQAIRYAILGWTGTEDAVTSDVVSSWTNSSYTAGGFFNSTTLSVFKVGAQTPTAATWTSLDAITATLGSTFNNIIIVVWTEGTAAQNFTLDFDYVQFEQGAVATEFERRSVGRELALCQRYLEILGPTGGGAATTGVADFSWRFAVAKRVAPTLTALDSSIDLRDSGSTTNIAGTWTSLFTSTDGANAQFARTAGTFAAAGASLQVGQAAVMQAAAEL